jgi:hypothetical protein
MTAQRFGAPMQTEMFRGRWQLTREIRHGDGTLLRARGTAELAPRGNDLAYAEAGELEMPEGPPIRFTRRLIWRLDAHGIAVLFEDGRPFHRFGPGQLEDVHPCAPDRYEVRYTLNLPWRWRCDWRVTGPAKDYAMQTLYDRNSDRQSFTSRVET